MPNTKDIQDRIKGVTSTHKITRTMEMVATSKFKRAVDRLVAARPFAQTLPEILGLLAGDELGDRYPLLSKRPKIKRVAVMVLTTNRGLCGPLNSNLLKKTMAFVREQEGMGREVEIHAIGKKGVGFFRFMGRDVSTRVSDLSDRPQEADAERFSDLLSEAFVEGRVDEAHIVYPSYKNAAEQSPVVGQLLPLVLPDADGGKAPSQFILEPEAAVLLGELLPLYLRNTVFRFLLEMAASEQGARRTAMKAATDSAEEMISSLTLSFNKARQAQITTELLEVVSGAEALR